LPLWLVRQHSRQVLRGIGGGQRRNDPGDRRQGLGPDFYCFTYCKSLSGADALSHLAVCGGGPDARGNSCEEDCRPCVCGGRRPDCTTAQRWCLHQPSL